MFWGPSCTHVGRFSSVIQQKLIPANHHGSRDLSFLGIVPCDFLGNVGWCLNQFFTIWKSTFNMVEPQMKQIAIDSITSKQKNVWNYLKVSEINNGSKTLRIHDKILMSWFVKSSLYILGSILSSRHGKEPAFHCSDAPN